MPVSGAWQARFEAWQSSGGFLARTRKPPMSAMHQQAMNHVYQQVLSRLLGSFSPARRMAVQPLIQRLMTAAGGAQRLGSYRIVYRLCGSTAGNCNLALLRAAQLTLAARNQPTFFIRAAVGSQALLDDARNSNVQRVCNALFLHDDPRVELLAFDNETLQPYEYRHASVNQRRLNLRTEMLCVAHELDTLVPAALQQHGYRAMARIYQRLLGYRASADAIVLDQPLLQRQRFVAWALRERRRAGGARVSRHHWQASDCLQLVDAGVEAMPRGQRIDLPAGVHLLGAHDLLGELVVGDEALCHFLGCQPVQALFDQRETRYPLMVWLAYLGGLRNQQLYVGSFEQGLAAFRDSIARVVPGPAESLHLSSRALPRDAAEQMQARLCTWYGMDLAQVSCAVYAPFNDRGARLEAFLAVCHPGMQVTMPYLHQGLRGSKVPAQVVQWLESVSGLPLATLQRLYQRPRLS